MRMIGVDQAGVDWHTIGYWASKRVANRHPEPYSVKYWEVGNEAWGSDPYGSLPLYGSYVGDQVLLVTVSLDCPAYSFAGFGSMMPAGNYPMLHSAMKLSGCIAKIKLAPENLVADINYRLPEPLVNSLGAGGGFEPPTFGL